MSADKAMRRSHDRPDIPETRGNTVGLVQSRLFLFPFKFPPAMSNVNTLLMTPGRTTGHSVSEATAATPASPTSPQLPHQPALPVPWQCRSSRKSQEAPIATAALRHFRYSHSWLRHDNRQDRRLQNLTFFSPIWFGHGNRHGCFLSAPHTHSSRHTPSLHCSIHYLEVRREQEPNRTAQHSQGPLKTICRQPAHIRNLSVQQRCSLFLSWRDWPLMEMLPMQPFLSLLLLDTQSAPSLCDV